jgi:hypothetical protein
MVMAIFEIVPGSPERRVAPDGCPGKKLKVHQVRDSHPARPIAACSSGNRFVGANFFELLRQSGAKKFTPCCVSGAALRETGTCSVAQRKRS